MAGSINKVILVGNLGRDPEVRATQDGSKIVNLSLATSERWKDRNSGEQREKTEWHKQRYQTIIIGHSRYQKTHHIRNR